MGEKNYVFMVNDKYIPKIDGSGENNNGSEASDITSLKLN